MRFRPSDWNWPYFLLGDLIKYLTADKRTRKILKYVPEYCQHCELLGMCRDEDNNWKCRRGCMLKWYEKK